MDFEDHMNTKEWENAYNCLKVPNKKEVPISSLTSDVPPAVADTIKKLRTPEALEEDRKIITMFKELTEKI